MPTELPVCHVRCGIVGVDEPFPGSTTELCHDCGTEVWVSPNTRREMRNRTPRYECYECNDVNGLAAMMSGDKIKLIEPSRATVAARRIIGWPNA